MNAHTGCVGTNRPSHSKLWPLLSLVVAVGYVPALTKGVELL